MSLLDDVSIVVTPNGYKAGTLFGVIPVPTEGAELVTNGDFATDIDWTKGTGWTISGGSANCDGTQTGNSSLSQSSALPSASGKTYKITFTISNYVSGGVEVYPTNTTVGTYTKKTANGTYTRYITVTSATPNDILYIQADSSFVGSIDNVSVKEYTSADMDVTRATAATRVDENGLVNYAEILGSEEVVNGDFATDSDWDKTGTWSIESNYATASGNSTSQYIQQDFTITNGKTYLFTYEIIENTLNGSGSALSGSGGFVQIFLSNVIGTHQVYITADDDAAAYALKIGVSATATTGTIKLDNVSVKEVTRDNVPRIDYTGGGCPHILAEPQRTNLITYSEDFTDSSWLKISGGAGSTPIVTSSYATSPEGLVNASRIQFECGGLTSGDYSRLYSSFSLNGSSQYSQSFYIKSNTGSSQNLLFFTHNNDGNSITATTEWVRVDAQFTSSTTNFRNFGLIAKGNIQQTVDVLIYGAQLEESYPTSYIPTSGSTVTRNQDIFTRDGIGSLINSTEGVLFVEMAALSDDGTARTISLNSGTNSNRIAIQFRATNGQINTAIVVGGAAQSVMPYTISQTAAFIKIALKYKQDDFALWVNGVEVETDTSGNTFSSGTINTLDFDDGSGTEDFYGKVKQLQVYNTALTDEQLLQLTGTSGTDFYESYAEMASALTYTIQ